MHSRWAITGGSGYVGRLLAMRLVERGEQISILSRRAVQGLPGTLVRGDLSDRSALHDLVEGADVVIHLASFVHRPVRTFEDRRECFDTNVGGTTRLVDAVGDRAPEAFVIGVSTSNVYGHRSGAALESDPVSPSTPYGVSKLESERVLRESGLRAAIVRPAMILGPDAPGNFMRLVRLVESGVFPEFGSSPKKSLIPVHDLIDALLLMAGKQCESAGETFNLGASGEVLTMREIADTIAQSLARKLRIIRLPRKPARWTSRAVDTVAARLFPSAPSIQQMFDTFTSDAVIDDTKVNTALGWTGSAGVRRTIDATVRAYRSRVIAPDS